MATSKTVVKKAPAKAAPASMTPLEKARLARAANKAGASKSVKGKKTTAPTRTPLPTWQAPEEFKPHFVEIKLMTEKDGLLASAIKATRFVGRYDPDAEDKKKFDIGSYDPKTVQGILARLSAVTYATNAAKRLPPNTGFIIVIRVNRKAADGSLSILFKGVSQIVKGKVSSKAKALEKTDLNYRKLRKAARILPVAFKAVLMPPKRTRGVKVESDE